LTSRHDAQRRPRARGRSLSVAAAALSLLFLFAAWPRVLPAARAQRKVTAPASPAKEDGPVSVTFGQLFKEGKTDFDDLDPATVAPLPKGYEPFGKGGYKIDTEAVAVGAHVVEFAFPSVKDRATFESLRILHAEWDKVDEKAFWVDCVYTEEGAFKSDFNTRTITVSVEHLGPFAVARLVDPPPPSTGVADLSVEIVPPRERINGNTDARYEIRITNRGPDDAANISLSGAGFSSNQFVSASGPEKGHGRCKQDGSNYACKLDRLEKGETAVFRLVLNPRENPRVRFPEEGASFDLDALAYSSTEDDKNFDDNQARSVILVYPDPNRAPTVELLAPGEGDLFAAPGEIKLSARAADPEGGIAKVHFYDGQTLVGDGIAAGKDEYRFDWQGAKPGTHQVIAVVTDNGGRADYDMCHIFVNGPLTVRVESPQPETVLKTKWKLTKGEPAPAKDVPSIEAEGVGLEASAAVGGPRVKEVVFFLSYGLPGMGGDLKEQGRAAGVERATGETRYTASFKQLNPTSYKLTVVAVDEDGVQTVSRPVYIRVSAVSPVRLSAEQRETAPGAPPQVVINAESVMGFSVHDADAERRTRVTFYADGKPIGTADTDSFIGRTRFVWTDATPGAHELTAVAANGDGAVSDPSPPLRFTVKNK
jgi:Bacterial Ig domain/Domain of unknown function DUF11